MKFIGCDYCGYSYFYPLGDESVGIEPYTNQEDLPYDFHCPHCQAPGSDFVETPSETHIPLDPKSLLDIEIEHIPQYQITSEGYTVCIGDEDVFHENTDEHQLYQIIVCQRDTHEIVAHLENPRIAEIFLLPGEFTFEEHELYTVCNQHGIWKGIPLSHVGN